MTGHLDKIKQRLEKFVNNENYDFTAVNYGLIHSDIEKFNLFVFKRLKTEMSGKRGEANQEKYKLHIIHEDYIPEGYVQRVIDVLESADGDGIKFKVCEDITYDYSAKGQSDVIVEMATIVFTRPERKYK